MILLSAKFAFGACGAEIIAGGNRGFKAINAHVLAAKGKPFSGFHFLHSVFHFRFVSLVSGVIAFDATNLAAARPE